MKYLFLVIMLGCVTTQTKPHNSNAEPIKPIHSCFDACSKLRFLGCDEGQNIEAGVSCEKFCEDTQKSGHGLDIECIMKKVNKCSDMFDLETTCLVVPQ